MDVLILPGFLDLFQLLRKDSASIVLNVELKETFLGISFDENPGLMVCRLPKTMDDGVLDNRLKNQLDNRKVPDFILSINLKAERLSKAHLLNLKIVFDMA